MVHSLADKTVLITGANNGIGAAMARAFAHCGARIGLHYLEAAPPVGLGVRVGHTLAGRTGAEAVVADVRALGASVVLAPGDLADPSTIAPLFDTVEAALGPVEVLINNAAHFENPDTVFDASAGTFDRYFAVNSRAPALLMGEFGRRHRARRGGYGRIINISTDAARAFATQIGYGASKLALEALTRSVACELGLQHHRQRRRARSRAKPATSPATWSGNSCRPFPWGGSARLETSRMWSYSSRQREPAG